jgi:hypothetical protein
VDFVQWPVFIAVLFTFAYIAAAISTIIIFGKRRWYFMHPAGTGVILLVFWWLAGVCIGVYYLVKYVLILPWEWFYRRQMSADEYQKLTEEVETDLSDGLYDRRA